MEIISRSKRKMRVVTEPHDTYSFYLPVETMERFRRAAEDAGRSYSEYVTDAITLFLATTIHIPDMQSTNGRNDD